MSENLLNNDEDRKKLVFGREILTRLDIEKELECPVCLIIPRTPPIFLCKTGHSVCFECFPRLTRNYRSRRCPICQAKYCNPPARNFLAEKLLECVEKRCRFDFRGCDYMSRDCDHLTKHEDQCEFKPKDFHLVKKPNFLSNSSSTSQRGVYVVEIIQACVQLSISILAVLVVLFFLVSLLSVLMGSMLTFAKTLNSCKRFNECQLNDPNFIDLWNEDLNLKFTKLLSSLDFVSLFFSSTLVNLSNLTLSIITILLKSHINIKDCHPKTYTSLYYDWPDTYLPSHLDNLVWRPGDESVESGNFTLVWDVDTNIYIDNRDKRHGRTHTTDPATVRAFMQWKMEMTAMPQHCQIVGVEMWHNKRQLQDWTSGLLYSSREIMIMSTVTGWNMQECPDNLQFGNITWLVRFNAEACRMKVDYIPEVNLQSNFIY